MLQICLIPCPKDECKNGERKVPILSPCKLVESDVTMEVTQNQVDFACAFSINKAPFPLDEVAPFSFFLLAISWLPLYTLFGAPIFLLQVHNKFIL